ncbi:hypothetical protein NMY22_g7959 [Coprinellus aureogranulatus]|nr:hypothetical protein NMY22_g7959 [Coprinellus aureogranulatus]
MDRAKYAPRHTHLCYPQWRRESLRKEERKKAPHILVYWDGNEEEEIEDVQATHVHIMIRAILFKNDAQLDDPNHEDAPKIRTERESDLRARERFLRFYKSQGVNGIEEHDFTFTWTRGSHPKINMVGLPPMTRVTLPIQVFRDTWMYSTNCVGTASPLACALLAVVSIHRMRSRGGLAFQQSQFIPLLYSRNGHGQVVGEPPQTILSPTSMAMYTSSQSLATALHTPRSFSAHTASEFRNYQTGAEGTVNAVSGESPMSLTAYSFEAKSAYERHTQPRLARVEGTGNTGHGRTRGAPSTLTFPPPFTKTPYLDFRPWQTVVIPNPKQRTEVFLSRSGGHPLTIRFTVPVVPLYGIEGAQVQDDIASLFELLCQHASRWKDVSLTCKGSFEELPVRMLASIQPERFVQLERLELHDHFPAQVRAPSFDVRVRTSSRNLRLSIAVSTIPMSDMLHKLFVGTGRLVNPLMASALHLQPQTVRHLLDALKQYPNLVNCCLCLVQLADLPASFANAEGKHVDLPRLEAMELQGRRLPLGLASLFHLPQLSTLTVNHIMGTDSETAFLEWGLKFGPQVTHVTIGGGTLSQESLLTFLRGMTNLTHLKITPTRECRTRFGHTVWQGLTPRLSRFAGVDCRCPKLQSLHCPMPAGIIVERSRLEKALVAFVVARRQGTVHGQVTQLMELRLGFPNATALGFRARFEGLLREKGASMDGFVLDVFADYR